MKISSVEFIKLLNDIPSDKLYIIACSSSEPRKRIHRYLENTYSKLGKYSLKVSRVERSNWYCTLKPCWECDKYVPVNNYHLGCMENNKDEYLTGDCSRCGEHVTFEVNYDSWDDVRRLYENNIIAVGSYMKHYNRPFHATSGVVSQEEFDEILTNMDIYELDNPDKQLNKRDLQKYIDGELEKLDGCANA